MCRNPASECKPIEENNEAAQEDNGSEDDNDSDDDGSYDSDDYYSETSSDRTDKLSDSESEAESSSGNRVSPDMVLLLMLKEIGAITEEKYNEKAEKCPYNFKSIIPRLPRSLSVDTIDYTKDLSETEDFNDDNENASKHDDNIDNKGISVKTLESHFDFLSSDERLNRIEKNFDIIDGIAFPKNNVTEDSINKEATPSKKLEVHIEINKRESEVDTAIKGNQSLLQSNHKEFSQKEQDHTVDREGAQLHQSSEDNGVSNKGDEQGHTNRENTPTKLEQDMEVNQKQFEVDEEMQDIPAILETNQKELHHKEHKTAVVESIHSHEISDGHAVSKKDDESTEGHTNRENTPTKLEQDMEVNQKQFEVDEEMQDIPAILETNQKELHHKEHKTAVVESIHSHEISDGHAVSKKDDESTEGHTNNGNTPAKKHASEVDEEVQKAQALPFKESVQSHENSEDNTITAESNKDNEHTMSENIKIAKEVICAKDIYDSQILVEDRNITGDKKNITPSEDNVILIENKVMETYHESQDTTKQDATSQKTQDDCQKENRNTKKESTSATGKITKSFKDIIMKLAREGRIPKEDEGDRVSFDYGEDYAQHLLSYANSLDSAYENNTALNKYDEKDDDDDDDDEDWNLREFAFFLNFYSPSSYKYILVTYNTPLPELKLLYSWYLKDDDSPGLTGRAFKILKEKSKVKRQTCGLMFIDVYLKNDGRYGDQVDYGNGEHCDFVDRAVLVYVFVLVSLDEDWKMPIGYIYARNVPAETQAELVRICLTHCHEAGADVVAVTMDTPEPAEFLGCNFNFGNPRKIKTTFKHPSCDRDVAVWIDPCLALKSARQLLKFKGVLRDNDDNKIRWSLIRSLRKLQSDDDFTDLEKPEFFALRNHIAKSGLTTETFSQTLVPAIRLGQQLLPEIFKPDTEPTVRYITIMNLLYYILNTRKTTNVDKVRRQLHSAKKYLIDIYRNENNALSLFDKDSLNWRRMQDYRYFLKGEPVCGIIAFLICIESFKHLHKTLVQERVINCLNPQRLSKQHAEDFVANMRAYHSYLGPEDLRGEWFQSFYKKIFDELEKNPQFSDKSVSLEHWPLQDRYAPAVTIKLTSGKRSYDDVYSVRYKLKKLKKTTDIEDATKLLKEYSKALDVEIDLSTRKNMVGYLAGWIAAKFARSIRCEACIDALCTDKKLWFHKFITFKRVYALCLPSEELFRVCWEVEKTLRFKRNPASVKAWVVRSLSQKFPWGSRTVPQSQQHHLCHRGLLVRAVVAKYTALRVPAPFSKKDTEKIVERYQRFTTKDPDDSYDELAEWLDPTED